MFSKLSSPLQKIVGASALSGGFIPKTLRSGRIWHTFDATQTSPVAWKQFFVMLFTVLGTLSVLVGTIIFFAWNWAELHKFFKFALVQGLLVCCSGFAWLRWRHWTGEVALLGVGILIGSMFALYGQIYQTGANSWEFFRAWFCFLVPLALLGRQAGLWFLAWLVGFLGLFFYQIQVLSSAAWGTPPTTLWNFLYLSITLALWECADTLLNNRQPWLRARWFPRIMGFTLCAIFGIVYNLSNEIFLWLDEGLQAVIFSWEMLGKLLFIGGSYWYYRKIKPDLFFLTVWIFSLATVFLVKTGFNMFAHDSQWISALFSFPVLVVITCGICGKFLLYERATLLRGQHDPTLVDAQPSLQAPATQPSLQPPAVQSSALENQQASQLPEALEAAKADPEEGGRYGVSPLAEKASGSETDAASTPWYLSLALALGAWGSALCCLVFTGALVGFGTGDSMRSALFLSAVVYILWAYFLAQGGLFRQQCAIAFGLGGILAAEILISLLLPSAFMLHANGSHVIAVFISLCLLAGVYYFIPLRLLRTILGLSILLTLYYLVAPWADFVFFDVSSTRSGVMAMLNPLDGAIVLYVTAVSAIICVLLGIVGLRLSEKQREFLLPGLWGAFILMPTLILSVQLFAKDLLPLVGLSLALLPLFTSLGTALTLSAGNPFKIPLILGGILAAVASWFFPCVGLVFITFVLARRWLHLPLFGLAVAFLALYTFSYYYSLQITLPYKALSLMIIGGTLLIVAGVGHLVKIGAERQGK